MSLGVRYVELTFAPPLAGRVETISNALASNGLTAATMHGPFGLKCDIGDFDEEGRRRALAQHREHLQYCAELGIKRYVIHPGVDIYGYSRGGKWDETTRTAYFPREASTIEKLWETNASSLTELGGFAASLNMRIALETGPPNTMTPSETIRVIKMAKKDNIGICVDTGHVNIGNMIKPAAAITEAGSLLWALHLHDNNGDGDFHRPPGKGNIDWGAVSKALRTASYDGTLNLEGTDTPDWFEWGKEGISFLSRVFE